MKLNSDNKAENFGHKKFNFRIDEKHQMKAIFALINLYQHKIQTPVQEIICNARDSHREVGKLDHTFELKVTETEFTCRDYGSGIDPDKAQNIFCSIGESTKTNDNTQTGGFGIGAKSPLAYVNSFSVESYVNGTMYKYIIAKNGELLEMNLIETKSTKQENGTKVIIPIKQNTNRYWDAKRSKHINGGDSGEFIDAVRRTCAFWNKRPKFNHKHAEIEYFGLSGNNYDMYVCNTKNNRRAIYGSADSLLGSRYIVIDGIPYCNDRSYNTPNRSILFFNTGDIRLHETRERLADNSADKEFNQITIKRVTEKLISDVSNMNKYVDNNRYLESFRKISKYDVTLKYNLLGTSFNKRSFDNRSDAGNLIYSSESKSRYSEIKYKVNHDKSYINYDSDFFYDDIQEKPMNISRRVKYYIEENYVSKNISKDVVILNDTKLAKLFKARKLSELPMPPKQKREKKKDDQITITRLNNWSGQDRYYERLDNITVNYLYIEFNSNVHTDMIRYLRTKGYFVCKLSKDSIDSVKNHPRFKEYYSYVDNLELNNHELRSYAHHNSKQYRLKFDHTVIDPKLQQLLKLNTKYYVDNPVMIPNSLLNKQTEKIKAQVEDNNKRVEELISYLKTFPLYNTVATDFTEYLNAVYFYRKNYTVK